MKWLLCVKMKRLSALFFKGLTESLEDVQILNSLQPSVVFVANA
ncbi:MAG: hypothetical protein AVDCRST_MAG86-3374 [uncultured Truepera sp.]|uniref:Uncharacterized protein n=1 Tax=uncultured Truepera sp. TaxID=543023 RepID=A0A6J4VP82_9DEIN|nr:MAG: hypothetical protein AVDCRST_MAG86-3374 [uncultured Truepera sp.]